VADPSKGLLTQLAERCATSPVLERAVTSAVRSTLPGIIQGVLRELFPGETVRLYIPKIGAESRTERHTSVLQALDAGRSAQEVAKALGVPARTVRHIRARRGTIGGKPPP